MEQIIFAHFAMTDSISVTRKGSVYLFLNYFILLFILFVATIIITAFWKKEAKQKFYAKWK